MTVIVIQGNHTGNGEQLRSRGKTGYDLIGATHHTHYVTATYVRGSRECSPRIYSHYARVALSHHKSG